MIQRLAIFWCLVSFYSLFGDTEFSVKHAVFYVRQLYSDRKYGSLRFIIQNDTKYY